MGQADGTNPKPASGFATFGQALKFARRRAQLSQEELARAVGFSREQITKLENNQRRPEPMTVRALFLPALDLPADSELATELLELAALTRSKTRDTPLPPEPHRTNLQPPLTRFIGRKQEVVQAKQLLATARFVTFTGAGGVGKTRLAIQVGLELVPAFPDGVWLVELASIQDPSLVSETVAAVFELPLALGRSPQTALAEYLEPKTLLLILDNCEHLLVACAQLAETLLRAAPHLRLLATSRESPGISSATTYRVPSLTLPTANASLIELAETEAIGLFLDRATLSKPTFALTRENAPYLIEICRRLDGVPLALELAAARVRVLTVQQIAERLSDRFRLLTGGDTTALPRHQTLRAMLDWSYDLLDDAERALFRELAVLSGGCDLDTLEALHGPDALELITFLLDKSMVVVEESGHRARYRQLETLREYALEKLVQRQELAEVRTRHASYFVEFIAQHEPLLRGPHQAEWYERFDSEQDNFRAALDWAIRSGNADMGLRLVALLWFYWFWRGHWAEGTRWAHEVLALEGEMDMRWRARALIGASNLSGRIGDYATCGRWIGEGTRLAAQVGDAKALAWAHLDATFGIRDDTQVNVLLAQALAYGQATGDEWFQAEVLHVWGERAHGRGEDSRAQELYSESERLFRQVGDYERVADLLGNMGRLALERDDFARAQAAFQESLAYARTRNNRLGVANWQLAIAGLALKQNDPARVMAALDECLTTFLDVGDQEAIADSFVIAANLANSLAQPERAASLLGAGDKILQRFNLLHQVVSPTKYVEFTNAVNSTRSRLSQDAFQRAWETGRTKSLQAAIDFALEF